MLSIYSWTLNDLVFMTLNIAATLIALINLWLAFSGAPKALGKAGEKGK